MPTLGGNIIVYRSVPWAKRGKALVSVKKRSFPKGATPAHLRSYTESFAKAAGECRSEMAGKTGEAKVNAFNECIKAKLK